MALFPKFSKKKDGVNVVMEQKLLQSVNNLILNAETCTGCGICVDACPEEAIVLGLVGASRSVEQSTTRPPSMSTRKSARTVASAS
jgi:4Fe-4S ferredoxin